LCTVVVVVVHFALFPLQTNFIVINSKCSGNGKVQLQRDGPSSRADKGVDLWLLACWDCGFNSRHGYECLSIVSAVCCQVEVSATGRSLVQRSPTDCGVSVIVRPRY